MKTKSSVPEINNQEKKSFVKERNNPLRKFSSNIFFENNIEVIDIPTRKAEEMNYLNQESNLYFRKDNTMIRERSNIEANRIQTVRSKSQFPNDVYYAS